MAELGRSGDYLESLGAHVHDAVTVAAGNEDAIRALQGLALTILRRPIADINELYAELDRFDRTEQRYAEIARAAAQEQEWENEVSHSLRLAFSSMSLPSTQPALAPTTALALSLATGIELWKQESERGEGGLLLAFTVAEFAYGKGGARAETIAPHSARRRSQRLATRTGNWCGVVPARPDGNRPGHL